MKSPILLALTALVLAGCAGRSASSTGSWYDLNQVDETPVLLECSLHEPPPPSISTSRTARVEVLYNVDATGSVVGAVPRLLSTRFGAGGVAGRALQVVNSCQYMPARLDGEAVAVRGLRRHFSFALAADG